MKDFQVKSADELSKMNAEELHTYYTAKLKHEGEVLEARVKALETEKDSPKFSALETEVKELKEGQMITLKAALVEQGKVIEGLKNGTFSAAAVKEAEGTIEKVLADNAENFKKSAEGRNDFKFELKAVGDMTLAGNVSGGTMPQPQRLDGVNNIAEKVSVIYGLIPKLNTDRNAIEWVYESGQEGTIDGTAEGATKDQIDNNFVVTSVSLVKRAAYFKVSTEMLQDVSFMAGWLRNKLIVRLFLDVNNQILNGDGVASNLAGLIGLATTFAAGTFALTVDNANNADSLVVAMNQIKIANQITSNLTILMYPSDVATLKLLKVSSTDKRYVDRLLYIGTTLTLDGVPIVESTHVAAGTFLVGDFSKALIVQKNTIMVEVGLDGNDFTKNMRTILAEWRGQVIVQNNDRTAFVKGTFATTNAALETA